VDKPVRDGRPEWEVFRRVVVRRLVQAERLSEEFADTPGAMLSPSPGSEDRAQIKHTLNVEQVGWYRAGSTLNLLRKQAS